MIKVQYTATVFNPDTEETFNGWVNPSWSMFTLWTLAEDVPTFEFETIAEAIEAIEGTIGAYRDNGDGTFYAEDSRFHMESGEDWSYAAHIEITR